MRNYFPAFFSHVTFTDGFNNFEDIWLSDTSERSLQLAQSDANNLSGSGYTIIDVSIIGKRWFELNKHFFRELVEGISPQQFWNNGTPRGLVTDKDPRDAGFNSKTEKSARKIVGFTSKNVVGKQTLTFLTYLVYLLKTWKAGVLVLSPGNQRASLVFAPKRWLDWLERVAVDYQANLLTQSEITGMLNAVDFSKQPPRVP